MAATQLRSACLLAGLLATLPFGMSGFAAQASAPLRDHWSNSELDTLASMRIDNVPARTADPSNAFETRDDAARLGRALFNDAQLSRNGRISCASCHDASGQFEDGRPLAVGLATGERRTMPVMGAAQSPFLFWDGRKDSLWSQALGPLENPSEQGGNRLRIARVVKARYADPYKRVFGPLPALDGLPSDASPAGTGAEQAAWTAMSPSARDQVNRVFANAGKAIAAYESRVRYGPSRFDSYVEATRAQDGGAQAVLSLQEVRGLRLFLGKGQCATCHNGPRFTDDDFHNTGVPPLDPNRPDRGRDAGARKLVADDFNCLSRYSDARPEQCTELNFLQIAQPRQLAAFRTPSLRNVATRAPYMHAGQFATLADVVQHYAHSPPASLGHSELARAGDPESCTACHRTLASGNCRPHRLPANAHRPDSTA